MDFWPLVRRNREKARRKIETSQKRRAAQKPLSAQPLSNHFPNCKSFNIELVPRECVERFWEQDGGDSFIPSLATKKAEGPDPPRVLVIWICTAHSRWMLLSGSERELSVLAT